jgi:hypothetical protein
MFLNQGLVSLPFPREVLRNRCSSCERFWAMLRRIATCFNTLPIPGLVENLSCKPAKANFYCPPPPVFDSVI